MSLNYAFLGIEILFDLCGRWEEKGGLSSFVRIYGNLGG